jgi:hypothetical protein
LIEAARAMSSEIAAASAACERDQGSRKEWGTGQSLRIHVRSFGLLGTSWVATDAMQRVAAIW